MNFFLRVATSKVDKSGILVYMYGGIESKVKLRISSIVLASI